MIRRLHNRSRPRLRQILNRTDFGVGTRHSSVRRRLLSTVSRSIGTAICGNSVERGEAARRQLASIATRREAVTISDRGITCPGKP
jgi:hypothetical protein